MTPTRGQFWPQSHDLKKNRLTGSLDYAKYQISKLCDFWQEYFLKLSPIYLYVKQVRPGGGYNDLGVMI